MYSFISSSRSISEKEKSPFVSGISVTISKIVQREDETMIVDAVVEAAIRVTRTSMKFTSYTV